MQSTVVRRIASALVLAAVMPFGIACIGLPLSLILFAQSAAVGPFTTLLFSPLVAVPIALLLGFPTLVALARFWRLGLAECALAGAACAIPGVYLVCNLMAPDFPEASSLGRIPNGELAVIAAAGAVYGGAFWAMFWVRARRPRLVASGRQ